MRTDLTGAELLAETLVKLDISVIFGIVGVPVVQVCQKFIFFTIF